MQTMRNPKYSFMREDTHKAWGVKRKFLQCILLQINMLVNKTESSTDDLASSIWHDQAHWHFSVILSWKRIINLFSQYENTWRDTVNTFVTGPSSEGIRQEGQLILNVRGRKICGMGYHIKNEKRGVKTRCTVMEFWGRKGWSVYKSEESKSPLDIKKWKILKRQRWKQQKEAG